MRGVDGDAVHLAELLVPAPLVPNWDRNVKALAELVAHADAENEKTSMRLFGVSATNSSSLLEL